MVTLHATNAQQPIPITQSHCDGTADPFKLRERIIRIDEENDSLLIVLGKREMCCAEFKAQYEYRNDTLRIQYTNHGDECFCSCFYELTFKVPKTFPKPGLITFNGWHFMEASEKYSVFQTQTDTLKNGNILVSKFENSQLITEVEHQDSLRVYRQFYRGKMIRQQVLAPSDSISLLRAK